MLSCSYLNRCLISFWMILTWVLNDEAHCLCISSTLYTDFYNWGHWYSGVNWEFTFFIFYLNTLCNSYISDIVFAFCSNPNIKVSYNPFILVKYYFIYSVKLKFSFTCLLFSVDNLMSIYPDIENNPSRDLGPASFSYYLNIFFSKSKSLQSKNYSRSLHFNYFFIIKLFKNDYRNNICLFIVAG